MPVLVPVTKVTGMRVMLPRGPERRQAAAKALRALVEAHDLATPAIAVVAGGLADAARLPALRPFSRILQSPIPCGGNVNLFES